MDTIASVRCRHDQCDGQQEVPLILLIDCHDSYTFNLYHLLADVSGTAPTVVAIDQVFVQNLPERIRRGEFSHLVLSPGPGHPSDYPELAQLIDAASHIPLLGVCLGHQALTQYHGAGVEPTAVPVHGTPEEITHDRSGIFHRMPSPVVQVRYHSLAVHEPLPKALSACAWSHDDTIMAIKVKDRPHWGVQFHPEAYVSECSRVLIEDFLRQGRPPVSTPPGEDSRRGVIDARSTVTVEHTEVAGTLDVRATVENLSVDFEHVIVCEVGSRFTIIGVDDTSSPQISFNAGDESFLNVIERDLLGVSLIHSLPDHLPFHGGWMGYIGFEALEQESSSPLPDATWIRPEHFFIHDREESRTYVASVSTDPRQLQRYITDWPRASNVTSIRGEWDSDDASYIEKIHRCLEYLRRGDSYEICLTDSFRGRVQGSLLSHYRGETDYGAYLKLGDDLEIVCHSPELFLSVDQNNMVSSGPIKGTAKREDDPTIDALAAAQLAQSDKTRAENMMIVDLTRNDLGRVCQVGSVQVPSFMRVESQRVHSLVSTVTGKLLPHATVVDAIRECFPPGSMTGAPKKRSLEIIRELERGPRGIYSGCIGYIGYDGTARLNVVIRTIVRSGKDFSIGAGGAIVLDSDPGSELAERNLKAAAFIDPEDDDC